MHGLSDNIEIRVVGAPVAAGSTIDNNSSIIDMADYESVTFVAPVADSAATGVATLSIEQSDTDSDGGMTAVAGSSVSATSAVNDDLNDKVLATEVFKPAKRYVQAVRTSATANIAYGSVIALLVPYRKPAVQGATVLGSSRAAN